MLKKKEGKKYILIYINVQKFNIWKNCNLKVYMHSRLCMHEHFDLIIDPFKYKCENFQVFIHPLKKIIMITKCNSWVVDSTTIKVNDSTHMQMLIVQDMWKRSLTHSSINVRH
jgi:hypothetical protein